MMENCSICQSLREDKSRIFMENEHAFAMIAREPQFEGHSMVLPKRHVLDVNELTSEEALAINHLICLVKKKVDQVHNCSSVTFVHGAGQKSQPHLHHQILPLKPEVSVRHLIADVFKVPLNPQKTVEELKAMADKLRE